MKSLVDYTLRNGGMVYPLEIPEDLLCGNVPSSPTCVVHNGKIIVSIRVVNYTKNYKLSGYDICLSGLNQDYTSNSNNLSSYNVIGEFCNGKLINTHFLGEADGFDVQYQGLEDVRLVVWNNHCYAYGTRWDKRLNQGVICIYKLNDEYFVEEEFVIANPDNTNCEKNWAAISDKPLRFVYQTNPTQLVNVVLNFLNSTITKTMSVNDNVPNGLRGNSTVVRYNQDCYIELVHKSEYTTNEFGERELHYRFAFVFYDNRFNIIKITDYFNFRQDLCEFSCGIAIFDDKIYICFSELDASSNIIELSKENFEFFINNGLENTEIDLLYFQEKAVTLFNSGNIRQSIPFFNYCCMFNDNVEWLTILALYFTCISTMSDRTCLDFVEKLYLKYKTNDLYLLLKYLYRKCGDDISKYYTQNHNINDDSVSSIFLQFLNPYYI